jgi:cytochrome c biogenesis protein CcmG/thiol:disulfide interchange protein DsbE
MLALALTGALALSACAGGGDGAAPDADAPQALSLDTGTGPLPAATFADLRDPSVEVSTTDWLGTPTLVNFWATWCGFCTEEMPDLQAASQQLDGQVRFVGIDRQDPRDEALAFLQETGVTYDQVASPAGEYYTEVGARGMPTTLFVDADGVVAYRHTGPLTEQDVLELVEEHLGVTP